ncbi:MAG: winged helix-turn-helix transcriptional regulator [Candidatus Hodarchaeota archaeon]
MDKTDIILSMLLLAYSRISYRELAEKLNLSANAVHKRIQTLINLGIIRKFTTKISISALQAIMIFIYGKSEVESIGDLHQKLNKHGSIWWVTIGGGNFIYIGAYLKSLSETESIIDYIKNEALIPNPSFGIINPPPNNLSDKIEKILYPLDRQIISSLSSDSRKTIADIADEIGVAAKTIRRRLSAMIRKELLEFSIQWYPDASNDIITVIHIRLKPEADKTTVANIMEKYFPNLLLHYRFINVPNELFCIVWTNTMKELRDLLQSLADENVVSSIVSNILYTGYIFDTWRDELVKEKGAPLIKEPVKKKKPLTKS